MSKMSKWRVGNKIAQNLYKNDIPVAMCQTSELALEIAKVMNSTIITDGHGEHDGMTIYHCQPCCENHNKASIPMLLYCPECSKRHLDIGEFATKPHHTHACQSCGHVWRPAVINTVGVQYLPGFKNDAST